MGKTRAVHNQKYKKEYGKQFPVAESALGLQHAFCIVCSANFSINHGGMNDIQKHMNSKKHKAFSEIKDKARPISTFFSSSGDLDVIRAETLFTEFIIEHNLPFSVADHCTTKLFRKMWGEKVEGKGQFAPLKWREKKIDPKVLCTPPPPPPPPPIYGLLPQSFGGSRPRRHFCIGSVSRVVVSFILMNLLFCHHGSFLGGTRLAALMFCC